jgi:hypothetical protein
VKQLQKANELYRKDGWNASQVEPTEKGRFFNTIAKIFGGEKNLAPSKTFNLTDPDTHRNQTERQLPKSHGFRLVQDVGQSATLVSGTDGNLYMVNNSINYDISSPWVALNLTENKFSFDVFDRLIYYNASRLDVEPPTGGDYPRMIEVGVADATSMPFGVKAA